MIVDTKDPRSKTIKLVSDRATKKPRRTRGRKAAGLPDRRRALSLVGQEFHKLRVVAEAGRNRHGHQLYRCACSCGGESIVTRQKLVSTNPRQWTTSCGCVKAENFVKFHDKQAGNLPTEWLNEIFRYRLYGYEADSIARREKLSKATVDAVIRITGRACMKTKWMPVIKHGIEHGHNYFDIASRTGLNASTVAYIAKRIRGRKVDEAAESPEECSHSQRQSA